MCGIIGYIGDRDVTSVLLVGLDRLSYRGYDSAGIATITNGELSHWKKAGKIRELNKIMSSLSIPASLGIGHTRWATHGAPNDVNGHPHISNTRKIALVHNGIIENHSALRKQLINDGHLFRSETDTEVLVHLIEDQLDLGMIPAIKHALSQVEGTYAIAVVCESEPDKVFIARKGSPLLIGLGKNDMFVSSDINNIITHTRDIVYLEDHDIGYITKDSFHLETLSGESVTRPVTHVDWNPESAEKHGYDHFMLKEIYEQPSVIRKVMSKYVNSPGSIEFKGINPENIDLDKVGRFIIQACGTSWHSGLVAKYMIEKYAKILTEVDISSEFRYRQMIAHGNDVVIAISQSGETADTLACLREAKSQFFKAISFVNVKESSIDRASDGVIYSHTGPEIGVASTKNYIAQLVCLYLFALKLGHNKQMISSEELDQKIQELQRIPEYIDQILKQADDIKRIAQKYALSREFLFIGRGVNYPTALEGALKLKEISYIHATGYAAGELKHGPIALIDSKLPVVCIAPKTSTYAKMLANIEEVRSRKGKTIVIATEGDTEVAKFSEDIFYIPEVSEDLTPLLTVIPLQLLSYYIANELDCDVDQPRNLAKSVTVE